MTQNIVFRLNHKIKMSRNPPKIYVLKSYVKGLVSPQVMVFLHIEISFQKIFCCYVQFMKRESKLKPRIN